VGHPKKGRGRGKVKKPMPNTTTKPPTPHIMLPKLETHNKPASVWNNKIGCGRVVLTGHLVEPRQRESMHS
jgi:hypothetical protein